MSEGQIPTLRRSAADLHRPQDTIGVSLQASGGPIVLGRYRLSRRLGVGGFGTVWLARDEHLARDVAVKIVARERIVGGRLQREAHATARLAHPGIVTLYEAGADDDGAYLVSELVRGGTLAELLAAGRLSDRDVVAIGVVLCDALEHAHSQGVVHRDVKPSNVLVPERPATPAALAKLTDFGVARVIGGDSLTRTGDVIGTAAYMAPEQAHGREAGVPADLYALALVLYESLTGVNPICTASTAQRARRLRAHLPPLRRQRRDLPRELGQAIDLALRPRPSERGSLESLRGALVSVLGAMDDQPGMVGARWSPRAERRPQTPGPPAWEAPSEPAGPDRSAVPRGNAEVHRSADVGWSPRAPRARAPERVIGALATAGLIWWLLRHVGSAVPVSPTTAALIGGAVVAALPRLGWIALALALSASVALGQLPGAALLVGAAAFVPMLLLPGAGWLWSLVGAAPALGAIGLAGAWPALAARAASAWRRAGLGIAGWAWLVIAQQLAGVDLYTGSLPGIPPAKVWTRSLDLTLHAVVGPIFSAGLLAPALVWGAAATVAPWLVRGKSPALDLVRVGIWSITLVSATSAAVWLAGGTAAKVTAANAALGALAGAAVVLAPTAIRLTGRALEARDTGPGLP